ncbi:MAG: exodeoxyribonuclease V subunit gamma [Acidimicrobiales bacterium]
MLILHRSERADYLVESLGDLLVEPLGDAMAPDVVAVPTRGVERWLTQRLSHRLGTSERGDDGVCANIEFPFPGSLVNAATAAACDIDPAEDPWSPDRAVWPLVQLVDRSIGEAALAPLAEHLRSAYSGSSQSPHLRRFPTVRHLADLYDRYAVHRPDMVLAWAAGDDDSYPLKPDLAWQAELWRRLRREIGEASPAERLEAAIRRLEQEPGLVDLPERLSVFGLTRLPASHLKLLKALGAGRDVHLFLLHPSGELWARLEELPDGPATSKRSGDTTAAIPMNPLLRSWARDAREMQLVLRSHGIRGGEHKPVASSAGRASLLELLQQDIRGDHRPPGAYRPGSQGDPRPLLDPLDDSVRVHACHGKARQVEVVRDAILHLLAGDLSLEPRDVIVMCPDIESFAPLVQASFGVFDPAGDAAETTGTPALRVRLADRSLRQTNPLLAAAAHLLEMSGGRVTASDVLDFASREPVSRRFGFDEDDLSQVERWVVGTGVRWGLDGDHRGAWNLEGVEANTWSAGLDRLLLGVAMAESGQRLFGGVLPFDDVQGLQVDLAGRLAEMVSRLGRALDSLSGAKPSTEWTALLAAAVDSLAMAEPSESWQRDQLRRLLAEAGSQSLRGGGDARSEHDGAGAEAPLLDLSEVRSLLDERLRGRPTRANFRTGDLTVCTLVPMRSVPHRVVCLLGLDDGIFPRSGAIDGDDLLQAAPELGDRDSRSEDRQLLLDAVLAATDHLVVTYEGRDQRTNQARPPAVPVSELLDVIDRTVRVAGEGSSRARDMVVVSHPLQSFDARNFTSGELGPASPWSFDPVNLEGARALARPARADRTFLPVPLPARQDAVIQLASLVRFLEHPVKRFLAERLGLYLDDGPDPIEDDLHVELDGLAKWAVGDRLLSARLAGASAEEAATAERGRGLLPPAGLGEAVLGDILPTVNALVSAVEVLDCWRLEAESKEVNVALADGRTLVGTVPGLHGATILHCVYSRLAAKHRLAAWARFLALSAARPDLEVTALTIGRGTGSTSSTPRLRILRLPCFTGGAEDRRRQALADLGVLVDLYDRGLREPLPLACDTSAAWAFASLRDTDAPKAAREEWTSYPSGYGKEDSHPAHRLVWGDSAPLEALLAIPPAEDETGAGWVTAERSRFGRLSRRLWDGLLEHEVSEG